MIKCLNVNQVQKSFSEGFIIVVKETVGFNESFVTVRVDKSIFICIFLGKLKALTLA